MKNLIICIMLLPLLVACGGRRVPTDYDARECTDLSIRIERRDSLSQYDYACIIAQNRAILEYLVERAGDIDQLPDSTRYTAWRQLLAEPEYLERFGYMFTLGSALYNADIEGFLDDDNARAYAELDTFNHRLATLADRF